mmetsp:Transcript_22170/g.62149  ORF Transcript_22170/g.62149 Transcript_22170/m.62149 type:complete len:241 (+) Transcript_22170:1447-2169(+)
MARATSGGSKLAACHRSRSARACRWHSSLGSDVIVASTALAIFEACKSCSETGMPCNTARQRLRHGRWFRIQLSIATKPPRATNIGKFSRVVRSTPPSKPARTSSEAASLIALTKVRASSALVIGSLHCTPTPEAIAFWSGARLSMRPCRSLPSWLKQSKWLPQYSTLELARNLEHCPLLPAFQTRAMHLFGSSTVATPAACWTCVGAMRAERPLPSAAGGATVASADSGFLARSAAAIS